MQIHRGTFRMYYPVTDGNCEYRKMRLVSGMDVKFLDVRHKRSGKKAIRMKITIHCAVADLGHEYVCQARLISTVRAFTP